jgi:hypothetical protein
MNPKREVSTSKDSGPKLPRRKKVYFCSGRACAGRDDRASRRRHAPRPPSNVPGSPAPHGVPAQWNKPKPTRHRQTGEAPSCRVQYARGTRGLVAVRCF